MKRRKVICFGTGSLAELMHVYLSNEGGQELVGFVAEKTLVRNHTFRGLPVHAFEEVETFWDPAGFDMLLAIGYRIMRNRKRLYEAAKAKGYRLANFASKQAIIADDLLMGDNNIIMPNVHIEPFVRIGSNNILWSNTLICHHARIGHHNFFAPNSAIAGEVTIGDLCFFGIGSIISNKVVIGDETQVAPGSTVLENTSAHKKYLGTPARPVKQHLERGIVIGPKASDTSVEPG
jgi:UDP-N-acetylbacillosamine N-acetyltransferase